MEHHASGIQHDLHRPVIIPVGTNGDCAIDSLRGSFNFGAGSGSLTVQNKLCTVDSSINCQICSNDATMKSVQVLPNAGFFTVYAQAAPTAATVVRFNMGP